MGTNGGIAGVGEGAGLPVAETGDIIFVPAEVLFLGGSRNFIKFAKILMVALLT